jgi:hypothetical protein
MSSLTSWATWAEERNWADCCYIGLMWWDREFWGLGNRTSFFEGRELCSVFHLSDHGEEGFEPVRRIIDEQDDTNLVAYEFG